MSKEKLEAIQERLREAGGYHGTPIAGSTADELADAIGALLRERESEKAAVTDGPRNEFPLLYDNLDALDERAAEQPSRIATTRVLTELRRQIGYVMTKLYGERAALEAVAPMLASAQAPDGWRSIESAPKDGTAVLLAFRKPSGEYNVHIGRWDAETFAKHPRPYWRGDRGYLGVTYYRNSQPTHWQPIAADPKPEANNP